MALRVESEYPSQRTNKTSKIQGTVQEINPMMTVYKSEGLPKVADAIKLASFIDYKVRIILLLKS